LSAEEDGPETMGELAEFVSAYINQENDRSSLHTVFLPFFSFEKQRQLVNDLQRGIYDDFLLQEGQESCLRFKQTEYFLLQRKEEALCKVIHEGLSAIAFALLFPQHGRAVLRQDAHLNWKLTAV
jgi:hypothetical protein